MTSFATNGATTSTQINAVAAAGCTHNVVAAYWGQLQPGGAGSALDSTALANLNTVIGYNIANGLKTILEHALHYPPSWVVSAVEPFTDQNGNTWSGTSANGDQVRNWMWTSLGRTYVADFITKVYNGLTSTNRAAVDRIRFGGGAFGELHYPTTALSSPYSYWAFGTSMQTGTGLATGLTAAPDASYTPFTGTTTQDDNFIAWYLGGLSNWLTWFAGQLTSAGWTCDLMCLHPGYGIRSNQVHSNAGFRQALSCGEDPATMIAAYAGNAQVWPWCTWINGADGWVTPTVDSDQAAWKKVFAEAYKHGKHTRIWGENTGGESNLQMGAVFHNALIQGATPITGDPLYPSGTTAPDVFPGYVGLMWLNYSNLTAGGSNATLATYQGLITHTWPDTYQRGISNAGGGFGAGAIPGTYDTDYHYDSAASLSYLAGRGHKIVRLPFLWERIQRTLGGALDATELGRLQAYVAAAHTAGLGVVLDVHSYARYTISGTTHVLGDGTLTQAHFADLWTRLSTAFNGVAGIAGYGLMNEPHDLSATSGSFSGTTRYDWASGVQGWTGDSATASNVSGKLRLSATVGSGNVNFRKDDAGTVSGGSGPTGAVIRFEATLVTDPGSSGGWTAKAQWQNSGFSWQNPTSVSFARVDTGAAVSGLVSGVAVYVTCVFSSITSPPNALCVQIDGTGATAGTCAVDIDNFAQGSLTGGLTAAQVWEAAAQAAVTAIRGNSDTTPIMVGGYGWSSADNWQTNHPAKFITDPASNHYYEAHLYFDDDASGAYANSFATETTDANGESFYSVLGRARTRLSHFTDWCAVQGVKGFIGEMGWPSGTDATSWNAVGEAVYSDADRAGLWVAYWAAAEWFGTTYALSAYVEHSGGTALDTTAAQATIIEAHPSIVVGGTGVVSLIVAEANTLLDSILAAYPWIQLHIGVPGAAGTSNVATNSTRQEASCDPAAAGSKLSNAALTWTAVPATELYTHVTGWSSATGGTCGFSAPVTAAQVQAGGVFVVEAGAFVASFAVAA